MKIYTNTFDLRQPSEKKFWVSPHSDFKIGIKVIRNKPIQYTKDIWLFNGNTRIFKESEDNDFTYFKIKSGDTGEVKYTIVVIDGNIKLGYFTLTQVVTDSTVYEQESGGELPAEVEFNKVTVGTSIINEGDIECDDLETQIINSTVGEFVNLKTTEFTIGNTEITEQNIILNDGDVSKIKTISQADYDSLSTKDENTLYIITE